MMVSVNYPLDRIENHVGVSWHACVDGFDCLNCSGKSHHFLPGEWKKGAEEGHCSVSACACHVTAARSPAALTSPPGWAVRSTVPE